MARHDRCTICDYSESDGAGAIGVNPGGNGKVRLRQDEMTCDQCAGVVGQTLFELEKDDEE